MFIYYYYYYYFVNKIPDADFSILICRNSRGKVFEITLMRFIRNKIDL